MSKDKSKLELSKEVDYLRKELLSHIEETKKAFQHFSRQIDALMPKQVAVSPEPLGHELHVRSNILKNIGELMYFIGNLPESKELSIAKTKLEEFQVWIEKAIK